MQRPLRLTTHDANETSELAIQLAKYLSPGSIVGLFGTLGSGKTVFSQALGRAFRIRRPLRSPTFVIESRYPVVGKKIQTLYHLDLYRLRQVTDRDHEIVREAISDRRGVTVIEWADRLGKFLPKKSIRIHFRITLAGRTIRISGLPTRASKSLERLASGTSLVRGRQSVRPSVRRRRPSAAR